MSNLKEWLTPAKINKNLVLEIIYLLLKEDGKERKPLKVKVDEKVTIKPEKPKQVFDDLKENDAGKFLPERAD